MNGKMFYLLSGMAAVIVIGVMLWRNTPYQRAVRFLNKAAALASVVEEDSEIARRMKGGRLRRFVGYEVHVDVKGIAQACDLMQDDVLAAWAYVVGPNRFLKIDITDLEIVESVKGKMVVNVDMHVESNYKNGDYSGTYPVVMDLIPVEKKLRVSSIKSR